LKLTSEQPWIAFAGGGTAGHLFPALAVAEALLAKRDDLDLSFFVTDRRIDRRVLESAGKDFVAQPVKPFSFQPAGLWSFWKGWRAACAEAKARFQSRKPAVVVGSGGYAAGPALRMAWNAGLPLALLNPDAVPGRANRFFARWADAVFAQWETTRCRFPAAVPVHVTGCPTRAAFATATRELGVNEFKLDPARKTLLVTGASQGAHSINQAMVALAGFLSGAAQKWQVLHLSGEADRQTVADAYAAAQVPAVVVSYTDHMPAALAAADLIVSRAGASTLAEITAVGRPSILLPYPYHKDQHQLANAQVLERAEAALVLTDKVDAAANAARLGSVLKQLMNDPARLEAMSAAARRLGRPGAAGEIAELLLAVGNL
jgi:UDP-N-acetylglucosamine--N-acetylmuramyl-(pentapeptide) pyrophosphoryl-undecaprenol N-acetylglucosamine transferase